MAKSLITWKNSSCKAVYRKETQICLVWVTSWKLCARIINIEQSRLKYYFVNDIAKKGSLLWYIVFLGRKGTQIHYTDILKVFWIKRSIFEPVTRSEMKIPILVIQFQFICKTKYENTQIWKEVDLNYSFQILTSILATIWKN